MTTTSPSGESSSGVSTGESSVVADKVDGIVDRHPWLETVTQIGWLAKGVVYTLMGLTALQIAQQDRPAEDASPEGSIGRVAEFPVGRVLMGVLAVGLVLYFAWRVLSVASIRGNDVASWADRLGFSFSALFYAVLAWSAGRAAVTGGRPGESNSVEKLSRALLELTAGRWMLGVVGVATIGVGAYFVVRKGVQRSFVDELVGVSERVAANDGRRGALVVAGVAGWIGRGVVTALVGFFIVRAAVRFDPNEARGFDRTLRQVAGTGTGSALVAVCAVGLIAYGVFCLASHRVRTLEDVS